MPESDTSPDKPDQENEAVAVTGRPNDIPIDEPTPAPLGGNSTFAERSKERSGTKAVTADAADAENKAVTSASTKSRRSAKK